jgi:uncharacterized protein (TIGR03083 family)
MSDELPTASGDDDQLAALLALDALEAGEQIDAELRLDTWPLEQADATVPLAEAVSAEPPTDLRGDVLAAALARRPAGRPVSSPESLLPADAFGRTIEDFWSLLTSLQDDEWDAVAHEDHGRVRDLVAHLVGVEQLNLRWLDPGDDVPYLPDHVASTRPVVESLAEAPPADVVRAWHESALAMLAAAREHDGARQIPFHDIAVSVDGLMTIRTFELWAHGMDIADATGRPLPMLDDARLLLMSSRLMGALSRALAYNGVTTGDRTARFVLTGPAGGCYDIALDPAGSPPPADYEPDTTIVADVVDLCLVAAARLDHGELARSLEGDPALAELVLANVSAFARD